MSNQLSDYMGKFYRLKSDPTDKNWDVSRIENTVSGVRFTLSRSVEAPTMETRTMSEAEFNENYEDQLATP